MFDVITLGSASQDIVVVPKKLTTLKYDKAENQKEVCFPMGGKIDIEDMQFNSGGGATNTAATFALQGFKTAFCGIIGSDIAGTEIIKELKNLGIATNLVQKTDKKKTNHSVVILNSQTDRTILVYRGAAELMGKNQIPWNKLKTKWLYLAPLSGLLCDSFSDMVNFAVSKKIKIAVNPGIAQLSMPNFSEIIKKIDVLILNQEEASFLTKIPYEQEKEIFKKTSQMHSGITVMTQGSAGVMASDGNQVYKALPPEDRVVVDTTGAGDAFGSGFVSEFIRGANMEKAMQFAMGNSVGCISEVGAKNGLLKKGQEFRRVEIKKEM